MASITKLGDKYRANVAVVVERGQKAVRKTKVFSKLRDAKKWAAEVEGELLALKHGTAASHFTLHDACEKYIAEYVPNLKTQRQTELKVRMLMRYLPKGRRIGDWTARDVERLKQRRLKEVKPGTVIRELGILSSIFEAAVRDWYWLEINPIKQVRKPSRPKGRKRLIHWHEIKTMLRAMGYDTTGDIETSKQQVAMLFLLALRTGMRSQELVGLEWRYVHDTHVHLPKTKTDVERDVDLGRSARRILERMRGVHGVTVFTVNNKSRDALFRKYRKKSGLSGFTFHDSRHTAATILGRSGNLNLLELCTMFGWQDPKQAMVYFNPEAGHLSDRL